MEIGKIGESLIFAFLVVLIAAGPPIPTRLVAPPGPHFVGQVIELKVVAGVEGDEATIGLPKIDGAEIREVGSGRERIFRLIPRRAGALTIPPFLSRLGDRSGATRPTTLAIREPPLSGRPATFLGGIGPIRIEAGAEPKAVQVGETIEYRLKLDGPGAIGSVRRPGLSLGANVRVEPIGDEAGDAPPSRTFRYRLRPSEAGSVVLPPLAVSTFDPASNRYQTQVSASVKIRAERVEEFDPSRLVIEEEEAPGSGWGIGIGVLGIALVAGIGLLLARIRRRGVSPTKQLRRDFERLERLNDAAVVAGSIMAALADFLARRSGRPPGALTPTDAETWVDGVLGEETARLVADCDRVLYANEAISAEFLKSAAKRWLEAIENEARKRRERHS
jgi:hypothetical protein